MPSPPLDLDAEWRKWRDAPGQEANARMLRALAPTLDSAARANVGDVNALVRARARALALRALATYQPRAGTHLRSHVFNHLKGLKRYTGQIAAGGRLPERATLDWHSVTSATRDLTEQLGRDPSDDELADHSGFSLKRLRQLREQQPGMAEGRFQQSTTDGLTPHTPAVTAGSGPSAAYLRVIYDELGPQDQQVMEYTLGLNGKRVKPVQDIARALRRTPGWVSQRRKIVQAKLDDLAGMLPGGSL